MSLAGKWRWGCFQVPSSKFPPRWDWRKFYVWTRQHLSREHWHSLRSTEGREHGTRMTASRLLHRQRLLCHSVTAARGSLPLCLQLLDIENQSVLQQRGGAGQTRPVFTAMGSRPRTWVLVCCIAGLVTQGVSCLRYIRAPNQYRC